MRIAFGSDERTPLTDFVRDELVSRGHEVHAVGPVVDEDKQWAEVGREVGSLVARGEAATPASCSVGRERVRRSPPTRCVACGPRCAPTRATAAGARRWNDANVLVMSLRLASPEVAREVLDAWFSTGVDPDEAANIARLEAPDR